MERYLFFNSSQNDVREYQASDFAWYFGNVLKSGLIHTDGVPELQVKCEGSDLRTYVESGEAIIQGHAYENTSDLYLDHALPEATLDRIDRIVLRLDKRNQSRFIRLFVLQGEPAANPVAPTLQRDEFIHELSLAQIRVRANTSALNPVDLVDERLDESLCGLVSIQNTGFVSLEKLDEHENNYNASLITKGHVQLSNATNSTDETKAATPKAVKVAMDKANSAESTANSAAKKATGTYTGNAVAGRTISVGFQPIIVFILEIGTTRNFQITEGAAIYLTGGSFTNVYPTLDINSNGFKVGDQQSLANNNGTTYRWVAIG